MTASSHPIHDVIVVGGGVVGAALTLALQRHGYDVVMVERGAAPRSWDASRYDLRVYALSPASIALLDELGAWAPMRAARVSPYRRMRVWDDDPAQALVFDAADARAAQLGCIVENELMLSCLWQLLPSASIRTASAVTALQVSDAHADVTLADGAVLRARLVIATDGADSPLRQMAGIEAQGWSYPQHALVCHVQTEKPHDGACWQRFTPAGPLAFLPLADGRSSIVWSSREADTLAALDDAAFCARLEEASQQQLGHIGGCTARMRFPLRLLHAERYVAPRLALAGDAAHVVHPLAGQGVNLGLADVRALLQVLDEARGAARDIGGLRVLKRYERARRADNLDMLALTDALYRAFDLRLPAWNGMRALGLAAVNRLLPLRQLFMQRALGS
ncbi:MAG TPA: UbiH/UbiF/VisC/COQ6 family ubiquinone biosynthesis hydroxylase [Nevskiaceae bacterium]|nr:UbiH/UbiF/VisC/COQ6 family ubiquinone biosynthesis hydroxylase [Nevskiaceae bacterium]